MSRYFAKHIIALNFDTEYLRGVLLYKIIASRNLRASGAEPAQRLVLLPQPLPVVLTNVLCSAPRTAQARQDWMWGRKGRASPSPLLSRTNVLLKL